MPSARIGERAFDFACTAVKLTDGLWSRGPAARHIAAQLLRCSTSIGANDEEAQGAQTKPDFIAKLCVARKESQRNNRRGPAD